jgi:hypothetical protein
MLHKLLWLVCFVLYEHTCQHFSSNLGSRKWKSNNLQLARENARLKKDVQKWVQLHTEDIVRYNVLEMSWRRRGVSSFRLYEEPSVFDFIRSWLRSFENIVWVIQQENMISSVGNRMKNHAQFLSRTFKEIGTSMKIVYWSRIDYLWLAIKLEASQPSVFGIWEVGMFNSICRVVWYKEGSRGLVMRWRNMIDQSKLRNWIQEGVVALASIVGGSLIETEESRSDTVIRSFLMWQGKIIFTL